MASCAKRWRKRDGESEPRKGDEIRRGADPREGEAQEHPDGGAAVDRRAHRGDGAGRAGALCPPDAARRRREPGARPGSRSADRLERRPHPALAGPGPAARRQGHGRDRRGAARLARQGHAGLVRPRGPGAAATSRRRSTPRQSSTTCSGARRRPPRRGATRPTSSPTSTG